MKGRTIAFIAAAIVGGVAAALVLAMFVGGEADLSGAAGAGRTAELFPDYAGTTVPPNIAPLNVAVREDGEAFALVVEGAHGQAIRIDSRDGKMQLPAEGWRRLLEANRGGEVTFQPYVRRDGQWQRFDPVSVAVADDEVDEYLVYRLLPAVYNNWTDMGIYQRRLESYRQDTLVHSRDIGQGCVNCHTLLPGRADKFMLQVRQSETGPSMVLAGGGSLERVDLRSKLRPKTATYTSWHPSGDFLAFSQNHICQYFHTGGQAEPRDVLDLGSDLAVYSVADDVALGCEAIARKDRLETFPNWSADGKYLYYSSAVAPWGSEEPKPVPYQHVDKIKYDLMRIPFDAETGQWGQPETVLSASQYDKSFTQARVSPDGRQLLVVAHRYGSFPVFQKSADLWLVDLSDGKVRSVDEINSEQTDSWHSWSSNGRWIVFSSKRLNGKLSRPYLAHFGPDGRFGKPLLLPQEDPDFYGRFINNFNVPELSPTPVPASRRELARLINDPATIRKLSPVSGATPKGEAAEPAPLPPGTGGLN